MAGEGKGKGIHWALWISKHKQYVMSRSKQPASRTKAPIIYLSRWYFIFIKTLRNVDQISE